MKLKTHYTILGRLMNNSRIEELEILCAEAYIVIGYLAERCGVFDNELVVKVMDNLSEHKVIHEDIIPFHIEDIDYPEFNNFMFSEEGCNLYSGINSSNISAKYFARQVWNAARKNYVKK